jgi:hypothetical protein
METTMYKTIGPILMSMILTGCATTENYKKAVSSWMGADVNRLITSWGPPTSSFEMPNGNKIYSWYSGQQGPTFISHNQILPDMAVGGTLWCKTDFTVDSNGKVINWQFQGNACRAE